MAAEDDAAIRDLLEDALGTVAGWRVTAFVDGVKLLPVPGDVPPSLILLDLAMPFLSGLEVYRLLREREGMGDVSVLFITAATDPVKAAKLAVRHDYLGKPFDIYSLLAKAAGMMGELAPGI